jgi:hypothetical protein
MLVLCHFPAFHGRHGLDGCVFLPRKRLLKRVEHNQVNGKGTSWVHSQEGNICRTHFAPNGHFCLAVDSNLLEDRCECISNSVVTPDELVFLAT